MQYSMGLYKDAVFSGETTLKLDPRNASVQKWLPDAYAKLAEQKIYDARNDLTGDPATNPNCEARPEVIGEVGFFAVSYTHLDVYKRQLLLHLVASSLTQSYSSLSSLIFSSSCTGKRERHFIFL